MILTVRSYSELQNLKTFKERYEYLKLKSDVGKATFGYDRYLNQIFYKSKRWLQVRDTVIIRDEGCDLGISDYIITSQILIHHMNPIVPQDIINGKDIVYNSEFLICTTPTTHLAIHYGDESLLIKDPVIRYPGDTIPWR